MNQCQQIKIIVMCLLSFVFTVVIPLLVYFLCKKKSSEGRIQHEKSEKLPSIASTALNFLYKLFCRVKKFFEDLGRIKNFRKIAIFISIFIGIWLLRYSVGYYTMFISYETAQSLGIAESADAKVNTLNWFEEILNSGAHALQTFSMDEDYTFYLKVGKAMVGELGDNGAAWAWVYGVYVSIINFVAPIIGGAIVLEFLIGIFPQLALWWAVALSRCRKTYYFSELNARSLELAKSICEEYKVNKNSKKKNEESSAILKPTIVFTDAYMDDKSESHSELLEDAKSIGAICVREDIAHVIKPKKGKREYFLIDEKEVSNLYALSDLATDKNIESIKGADIYLFSQNDIYTQVERRFNRRLREEFRFSDEIMPNIIPIKSFRNIAINLFSAIPLYEPLVDKVPDAEGKRELTVTIVGIGGIGTEMLLTVYWMGQMLDCSLKINVVSKESKAEFNEKINYINPEILMTAQEGNAVLEYNSNGNKNAPYCKIEYIPADVDSGFLSGGTSNVSLEKTDYFIVSLGSDTANLATAEKLRRYIGECHIKEACNRRTVIAYAIYDSDLCNTLNIQKKFYAYDPETPDVYMHAFGCLREEYSCDNIFLSAFERLAKEMGENYKNARYSNDLVKDNKERVNEDVDFERVKNVDVAKDLKYEESEYNYWANIARVVHMKYKVFSLGWIKTSVFNTPESEHREEVKKICAEYKRIALDIHEENVSYEGMAEDFEKKCSDLSWLEHRRWSAFTRVMGFRGTDNYGVYNLLTNGHKHMSLRLHPCLVEADRNGVWYTFYTKQAGSAEKKDEFYNENDGTYARLVGEGSDKLDDLANKLGKRFKYNDSPRREFKAYEERIANRQNSD